MNKIWVMTHDSWHTLIAIDWKEIEITQNFCVAFFIFLFWFKRKNKELTTILMKTNSLNDPFLLIWKLLDTINRNFKHTKWFFDGEPKIIHSEERGFKGIHQMLNLFRRYFFLVKKPQLCKQEAHILSFWYVCKHWKKKNRGTLGLCLSQMTS